MIQMKIFAYIVSVIILMLTRKSLHWWYKANAVHNSEISQASNHENHENEADHCSPFVLVSVAKQISLCLLYRLRLRLRSWQFVILNIPQVFYSLDLFDFYIPPKS